jgi:hypothetical protein
MTIWNRLPEGGLKLMLSPKEDLKTPLISLALNGLPELQQ